MATVNELRRAYYIKALGLEDDTNLTDADLEYLFLNANPPWEGGGGGDSLALMDGLGPFVDPTHWLAFPGGETISTQLWDNYGVAIPILFPRSITIDRVQVMITVVGAATRILDIAAYTGSSRSLSLLHNFGSGPCDASIMLSGSWVIPKGLVWFALSLTGTGTPIPTIRTSTANYVPGVFVSSTSADPNFNGQGCAFTPWVSGNPPANISSTVIAGGNWVPKVSVRRTA